MLAVIGGSGVYDIDGLANTRWVRIDSPFGAPSDELLMGELDGERLAFLPRHGRGHRIPPSEINFRANIDALKRAGVTQIISVSAVGSLREHLPPGMFVLVDQFIDRTIARVKSFFTTGLVAHVSMARPVCARLTGAITVEVIVQTLLANADNARSLVRQVVLLVAGSDGYCRHGCQTALDHALITPPESRDPAVAGRLDAVAGRVLKR